MRTKQQKIIFTILIIYSALILYFMFLAFGRPGAAMSNHAYHYYIIPTSIPLKFPTMDDLAYFQLWLFNFGNLAGFIPFGILIPMLYRCKFSRFISLFFLSILVLETLQMLTFLGSFDLMDAIVNTIGAGIGFCAYKIGFRSKNSRRNLVVTGMAVVILSIGVIGFSELMNKAFAKVEGPVTALNELMDENLLSFEIEQEKIEPKINLYSSEDKTTKIFTYLLEGKDILLSLNYGIPDHVSDFEGEIIISVNGEEVDVYSVNRENRVGSSEFMLDEVYELKLSIKGNVKLWDVTYKEMKYWWN
ncbi:VanZ family protein [Lysinibacillus sp. NPDC097287]|uniref:VanZ family protein n=1 Tax=Lysinibacillus sp. NPDC097287 TaxID=3364144 RepID=UPI0037F2129F